MSRRLCETWVRCLQLLPLLAIPLLAKRREVGHPIAQRALAAYRTLPIFSIGQYPKTALP
jgi:hypothetical protein